MECLWRGGGSKNKLMEVECFAYCADEVFLYELLRILGHPVKRSNATGSELFDEATAQQSEFDQSVNR